MSAPIVLSDLLQSFNKNQLSLADLLARLAQRGPVQSPLHRADLSRLDEALKSGNLDEKLHRIISHKLKEYQAAAASDRTRVNPAAGSAVEGTMVIPPTGEDQTAINPNATAAAPTKPAAPDGFELLMANPGEDQEVTAFTPTELKGGNTQTGAGGPNTSSWNRLAAESGAAPQNVQPGMTLKERFYLEKEVGRGGMGVVYKARDERKVEAQDKNPWVAVKILNDEFRSHPQSLIALQREARKAQQLTHDNVLRVYDFDKAGTVVYVTMEYVDGGTVKEYIKKVASKGGISYAEARPVIEGMARGLGRAHRDNIVHADFKPGNVMLTSEMIPKVFDLGIARAAKTDEEKRSGETTVFDAATLGALTPAYASLEMMRGEDPQFQDDIYALAISAYECLSGKHPFNKRNAEEAFKAGMKPARIPGLTARQWKTLEKGLAFERKNRLKTCDDLIEGMRPRTMKDHALPVAISSAVAIGLIAGVFGLLLPKLQDARVDAMIQQFEQAIFTDHNAAVQALSEMDEADRQDVRQKGSQQLQDYFFKQANAKWSQADKKYDYRDAVTILKAAGSIYPDSKVVADNLGKVEAEKAEVIGNISNELPRRVEAGSVYEDQPDNAVELLAIVRRIDPKSELLNNEGLKARYRQDIRQALQSKDLELGEKRIASALKAYPTDPSILALSADVKATRNSQLAALKKQEQLAAFAKMSPEQVRSELVRLAAAPDFSPDWQAQVDAAVGALAKDGSSEAARLRDTLTAVFAQRLGTETEEKKYASAQAVAELGLRLFPNAASILEQRSKLDLARKAVETEQAAVAAKGQVADLKVRLVILAGASKMSDVERVRNDLLARGVAPDDPFFQGEGGTAITDMYVKAVTRQADQGRFESAQAMAAAGMKMVPGSTQLKQLERQYSVEANVSKLESASRSPATANGEQLKDVFNGLKDNDAARYARLQSELPGKVVAAIQALIPSDRAGATKAKAEWLKVFPQDSRLSALVIPEATVTASAAPSTAPSAAPGTSGSLSREASKARGAPTPGKACDLSAAGFGASFKAQCYDKVNGAEGPRLVVVPGAAGGVIAVTKYEITLGEYNAYCVATGKCRAQGGNDALPATGMSFGQAKAYAEWLSDTTGFTYRLPTDSEWTHIAEAGGKGPGADFNCILMQGSTQIKGGAAIDTKIGKANGWGLVNVLGNAAEWVQAGGGSAARGGNFNVPTAQCTVNWRDSGTSGSDTIGARLIRELG